MKALYKSQINKFDLIGSFVICSLLVGFTVWTYVGTSFIPPIAIISTIIVSYVSWCFLINVYSFYDDYIEIVWIFRLFKRKKIVQYSEINEIRYIHTGGSRTPYIVLVYKGKSFRTILFPSSSFTHIRFNKRKEILFYLQSKEIPIIINTAFKKEKEVFKNTPNTTIL